MGAFACSLGKFAQNSAQKPAQNGQQVGQRLFNAMVPVLRPVMPQLQRHAVHPVPSRHRELW
jgi:hypothetical protein